MITTAQVNKAAAEYSRLIEEVELYNQDLEPLPPDLEDEAAAAEEAYAEILALAALYNTDPDELSETWAFNTLLEWLEDPDDVLIYLQWAVKNPPQ